MQMNFFKVIENLTSRELLKIGNRTFLNAVKYPEYFFDGVSSNDMLQPLRDPAKLFSDQTIVEADYIIFQIGGNYFAKNGLTGQIEYSGLTDPVDVLQGIHDGFPMDTAVINTYFKPALFLSNKRLTVKNNRMRFLGAGTPHYYYGAGAWTSDGRYYYKGYANLLFGIDAYQPIDGYNVIFGNNTARASPSVALYVDLSNTIYPNKDIWTQGFEFINCRFMNGNPGLLHTGVNTPATDGVINSWMNRIVHCSFQYNARALDINNGTGTNFGFMCHMEDILFHDNSGDGTKPCINITPTNWGGVFKTSLIEGNGSSSDAYALYISTYGTGGLEIANIGFGDGNPPPWDAGFSLGRTTTIRHVQSVKGIYLSGRALVQAGALFGLYPYSRHELIFIPDTGVSTAIKFLNPNVGDTPTSADRLPQTSMYIDFNAFQLYPKKITNADSPYTLNYTDVMLLVDASGGNVTVNVPSQYANIKGTVWTIKRIDSSNNTVTVNVGSTTYTLIPNEALAVMGS
jgi:hypothetical protein